MKSKASLSDVIFYDKPPCYEHEVLANLEEIADKSGKYNEGAMNSIITSVDRSNQDIVLAIESSEKTQEISSRINAEIMNQGFSQLSYGLAEANFGLSCIRDEVGDLSYKISDSLGELSQTLSNTFRAEGHLLREEIRKSSFDINNNLEKINYSLVATKAAISMDLGFIQRLIGHSNDILVNISTHAEITNKHLSHIVSLLSKQKETQALELIDHANANVHMREYEKALDLSKKAVDLCASSSITVTATHIIILSLFEDKYKEEMLSFYQKFVNLVDYRLSSNKGEYEEEIIQIVYILHFHLRGVLTLDFIRANQYLYAILSEKMHRFKILLSNGISIENRNMVMFPNPLREILFATMFHFWIKPDTKSVDFTNYDIKQFKEYSLLQYMYVLFDSKVAIRNELLFLCCKEMYKSGILDCLLVEYLNKDKNYNILGEELSDVKIELFINLFLFFQYQEEYQVKSQTIFFIVKYLEEKSNESR